MSTINYSDNANFPYHFERNGVTNVNTTRNVKWTGQRIGEKVVGWKEKIRNGENASSDFYSDRSEIVEMSAGTAHLGASFFYPTPSPPTGTTTQSMSGYSDIPSFPIVHLTANASKASAIALSKTYKKLQAEYSDMNSPAILAEFGDVLHQFGHPAKAIIDLTNRHLNRLQLAAKGLSGSTSFRKVKWKDIVANTLLEYNFGLAPLISDTESAAKALARWQYETTGDFHFRKRIVSRATEEEVQHSHSPAVIPGGSSNWFVMSRTSKKTTKYRVQYVCGLNQSHMADFGSNERLLQILGFDHANWIPAVWEVVPWSWLIDYFANINQILDASVTSTTGVSWSNRTISQETTYELQDNINSDATRARIASFGWVGGGGGSIGKFVIRRMTVNRIANAQLGVPPLYFKHPFEDGKKIANMSAALFGRRAQSSALWLT